MRQMTNDVITVNVVAHIIAKNFWEYYVTDEKFNDDIIACVVYGHEIEYGDVSMKEIEPYVYSFTKELGGIMPAPGWRWVTKPKDKKHAPTTRDQKGSEIL